MSLVLMDEVIELKKPASLFERIGGNVAISAVVELFYERVLEDQELKPFFKEVDIDRLKENQAAFFTQALGGPAIYRGMNMRKAHENYQIQKGHFDRVAYHLIQTLKGLNVAQNMIDEVIARIAPLSKVIVNTQG